MSNTPTWDRERKRLEKALVDAGLNLLSFTSAHEATVLIPHTNPQLIVFVGEKK